MSDPTQAKNQPPAQQPRRALQVAQRGAAYGLGWRRPEAPEGASGAPRGESTKAGPIGGRGGAPSPPYGRDPLSTLQPKGSPPC